MDMIRTRWCGHYDLHLVDAFQCRHEVAHNIGLDRLAERMQGKEANHNRRKFLTDLLNVVSIALGEPIECNVKEVSCSPDHLASFASHFFQHTYIPFQA
jgi:hypothetical protein